MSNNIGLSYSENIIKDKSRVELVDQSEVSILYRIGLDKIKSYQIIVGIS